MPESTNSPARPLAIVIDDEKDIREMVSLTLEHEGWDIKSAANGREALELLRNGLPQLVVVDLMMSGMTGLEFCHKLLGLPGGGAVAVLLISGINEKAKLLEDFWELPLHRKNFLRKPFAMHDMIATVRTMTPRPAARPGAAPTPAGSPMPGPKTSAPPTPPPWMQGVTMAEVKSDPLPPIPPRATPPPPPREPKELKPIASHSAPDTHKSGYRVLIIDDEPDIRQIMETALGLFHKTATAENGMMALQVMEEFYPDFILSDINMPVMNGLDTAEAIRRHPMFNKVPIFFLSAERGADIPKRAYDVGGNLFLRKPVDPMKLINYIDFFLNETKLEPETNYNRRLTETGIRQRAATPKPPAATDKEAVRILTVDFNIEDHKIIKRILEPEMGETTVPGGPFELLWTEDPRTAIGNLARWQPDLILYNPRNPGFDGITFGQTLKLQKIFDVAIVLIGQRFYDADTQYAEKVLKTPTVDITGTDPQIVRKLGEVIQALRKRIRPKTMTIQELLREELEQQREMQQANARTARERETFRQRYSKIQEFIDKQYGN